MSLRPLSLALNILIGHLAKSLSLRQITVLSILTRLPRRNLSIGTIAQCRYPLIRIRSDVILFRYYLLAFDHNWHTRLLSLLSLSLVKLLGKIDLL